MHGDGRLSFADGVLHQILDTLYTQEQDTESLHIPGVDEASSRLTISCWAKCCFVPGLSCITCHDQLYVMDSTTHSAEEESPSTCIKGEYLPPKRWTLGLCQVPVCR